MIAKYGPVIKCTKNNKVSFKQINPDITVNIDKLKRGEYKLSELVIETKLSGRHLGMYKDGEVILKKGKFGLYIDWKELKKSIKFDNTKLEEEITLEEVIQLLQPNNTINAEHNTINAEQNKDNKATDIITSSIIRTINDDTTIRKGKYGDYIFYKKKTMKHPKFLKLGGFTENYKDCDITILKKWINDTYKV
jgi:topoisomerase IA-like protein